MSDDDTRGEIPCLDVGAGDDPHPKATHTLDIREDLPHLDFPGVDISRDTWPPDDNSVRRIVGQDILEHIPRERIGHVIREIDRVLAPGGVARLRAPHAGTAGAMRDPTHQGPGGFTPEVAGYFGGHDDDYFDRRHAEYWPDVSLDVDAWADLEFPTLIRDSLRVNVRTRKNELSTELVKVPFVAGDVTIEFRASDE